MLSNKLEKLLHLVCWFIWKTWRLYPPTKFAVCVFWGWVYLLGMKCVGLFCFLCCVLAKNVIFMEAAAKESIMIIVCKFHVYFKMKIKQLIKPLVPILSQIYPVRALSSYFLKIHFNIIYPLCLGLPSGLFPSGFPFYTWNAFLFSLACATCLVHIILLDVTHQQYFTSSIDRETPHYSTFSILLLLSLFFGQYLSHHTVLKHTWPVFVPEYQRPSFTSIQNNRQSYRSAYFDLCAFR